MTLSPRRLTPPPRAAAAAMPRPGLHLAPVAAHDDRDDDDADDADPDAPSDAPDGQVYALEGWLHLRRADLRRAEAIVARVPELDGVHVGRLRSRVTVRPALLWLTPSAWERVHAGLLSCAALARTGRISVSCDTWDGFIHATDATAAR